MQTPAPRLDPTLASRLENLSPAKKALLERRLGKTLPTASNPFVIARREDPDTAPVSFAQEGMLFMEQLDPGTSRYNLFEAVKINGSLDPDRVHRSLDVIVERHEALRTIFEQRHGNWYQVITDAKAALEYVDLSSSAEHNAIERLQAEADRPMDVECGPLFSALLVRTGDDEHYLLIKMHHIISDGWSLGVFWKEFASVYAELASGTTTSLAPLPIQFGDFASWSREYLGREIERQTKYWTDKLSGAAELLELPTDRPRPAVQTANGDQEIVVFPKEFLGRLNAFTKQESSTLYMTLLAGFNAIVSRYAGTTDLVIGTPVAGRNRTEIEGLIGYFVNTLVLRSDLSGDPTFREIVTRVKGTTLDAFSHQELPFEKVVAAVSPQRSLSYNPIYQVVFALQESSSAGIDIHGIEVAPVKLRLSTSKFDLFLSAREVEDGLAITVEYNTDLFDRNSIRRLISHYRNLLDAALQHPELRLSELPLLDEQERKMIVLNWNNTWAEYPKGSLHQLFAAKCEQFGANTAVASDGQSWTYAELDVWSNRIAHYLKKLGLRAGDQVGICMERSPQMIAAILAILKSGASYVPMDPANPASRLEQMITDSGMLVLIGGTEHVGTLSQVAPKLVDLLSLRDEIQACSSDPICVDQDAEAPACLLYTSGSTGMPKGVVLPHRAITRLVINTNYIQLGPEDKLGHVSNVAFDGALFDIWGALLNGGTVVVIPKATVLSPEGLASTLRSTGVTAMFMTTSLFNLVARERPDAFATLKTLMVGGEAFDPAAAESVFDAGAPERLLNVYGPTESTTFATWKVIDRESVTRCIPIGRPVANTTAYILDDHLNPAPIGVPGEIFIGGDGLGLGYRNRPELTAERFVEVPGEKLGLDKRVTLYRTGDIAKFLENGDIEYIGRKDHQVKIRGFRIELGEIESVIVSHPAVADAVVLAIKDGNDHRLIAHYRLANGGSVTVDDLRAYGREKLPSYMVPGTWIEAEDLALNANGKIDRKALAAKPLVYEQVQEETEPAKDELEVKLSRIWKQVLGLGSVGVKDNFFDLGGHSLAAVRVFSEIEKTLGCRLPLATLFKAPTVEMLAELIREGGWRSSWQSVVPVRPGGTRPPFFCVHAVGGNIIEYNELANNLSGAQPFYGLQSIGLDGRSAPLTDVGEMAAAYVREIRDVQPHGPYFVGGRSFGGTVAFEIARILRVEGEEVAMVAIFDSYPKGWLKLCTPEVAAEYERRFWRMRMERHLRTWMALSLTGKVSYGLTKLRYKSRKLQNLAWRVTQKVKGSSTSSVSSMIRDIEEINYIAVKKYVPEIYDGSVTFFGAEEEICPEENLEGWRLLAKDGVDVISVPGDHQTMIKGDNAKVLAHRLEEAITKYLAGRRGE